VRNWAALGQDLVAQTTAPYSCGGCRPRSGSALCISSPPTTLSRWPFIKSPRKGSLVPFVYRLAESMKVALGLAKSVINLARFVLGRTPAPVVAEGHGAERRFRNSKPAVSQEAVSHRSLLLIHGVYSCGEGTRGERRVIQSNGDQPEKRVTSAR
jgi:hypothetical protein